MQQCRDPKADAGPNRHMCTGHNASPEPLELQSVEGDILLACSKRQSRCNAIESQLSLTSTTIYANHDTMKDSQCTAIEIRANQLDRSWNPQFMDIKLATC